MKCAGLTGLEPQSLHGARFFFPGQGSSRAGKPSCHSICNFCTLKYEVIHHVLYLLTLGAHAQRGVR